MIAERVAHLVLFGEMASLVESHIASARPPRHCQVHEAETLENAVKIARQVARSGDVVLLSPGGTSFDAFKDFAERGDRFSEVVNGLE